MYQRYTDRARQVMRLADGEAKRFNHEYIGTEHILLGLVKEGSGVAANVLKNLQVDLRRIRMEVEKIVQSGPNTVTSKKLPLTPRSKKVIELAISEAEKLDHKYIGTEHLLLGLVREAEGVAAQVLMNLGLNRDTIRYEVLCLLGQETKFESEGASPLVVIPRRLMCDENRMGVGNNSIGESTTRDDSAVASDTRIRSLEQQLWNVRVVLGALVGALAGVVILPTYGVVIGLLLGGSVAALGRPILGALTGGGAGAMVAAASVSDEGGGLAGALLGLVVGFLIAEIGNPSTRRGFSTLRWRR
jgi:hypothetical protein